MFAAFSAEQSVQNSSYVAKLSKQVTRSLPTKVAFPSEISSWLESFHVNSL